MAMNRAVRRPGAWERPPLQGLRELRAFFATSAGGGVTSADVIVTGGGQAAVTLALRAILPPGAPLLVESPTYLGALACARAAGVRPVPVPIDTGGLRPDLLAEAFAVTGAKAVYCQPTFHNPTGASLSAARRAGVLDVARAAGAFVIEDDFARHLAMTRAPAPPPLVRDDRDGVVVHIASLTKVTSPSMRVAAVIARGPVAERIAAAQVVDQFFVARPLQEAAIELVTSAAWPRHLRALSGALRRRRDILVSALGLPVTVPAGGMHLWFPLPADAEEAVVAEAARRAGVTISVGRPYFPAEPPGPFVRLSHAIAATEAGLAEGAHRVADLLAGER
jgi:DNA-binding transcriptional MocR family regulator